MCLYAASEQKAADWAATSVTNVRFDPS